MTNRLAVHHTTRYRYEKEVTASYNEVRITPPSDDGQQTRDASIRVEPAAPLHRYRDYWGTIVGVFDLHVVHDELTIVGHAIVDTAPQVEPSDAPWTVVHDDETRDRYCELLLPTAHVPISPELSAAAAELRSASRPRDAVAHAIEWTREQLVYEQGTTTVASSATDAWHAGRGVCQDFAHLTLAVLRAAGIPSRYVSGYLHPAAEAAEGETALGESHAWVEAWVGSWWPVDPTNGEAVGDRHVRVARGRDYGDVAPVRGVYSGDPEGVDQSVTVELTRVA